MEEGAYAMEEHVRDSVGREKQQQLPDERTAQSRAYASCGFVCTYTRVRTRLRAHRPNFACRCARAGTHFAYVVSTRGGCG